MALFIGRLGDRVKLTDLEDVFGKFGRMTRCFLKPGTAPNNNFGFITYEDMRDAEDAYDRLQGAELEGSKMNIEWARESGRAGAPPPRGDSGSSRGGSSDCYECGKPGHLARNCPIRIAAGGRRGPTAPSSAFNVDRRDAAPFAGYGSGYPGSFPYPGYGAPYGMPPPYAAPYGYDPRAYPAYPSSSYGSSSSSRSGRSRSRSRERYDRDGRDRDGRDGRDRDARPSSSTYDRERDRDRGAERGADRGTDRDRRGRSRSPAGGSLASSAPASRTDDRRRAASPVPARRSRSRSRSRGRDRRTSPVRSRREESKHASLPFPPQ